MGLASASTSDDILTAFGFDPIQENTALAYVAQILLLGQSEEYNYEYPSIFIGNYACNVYVFMDSGTIEMELSYIGQGGVLKTVKVTCKEEKDGKFTYSVCFYESGGEEVYLPSSIFDLTKTSTKEESSVRVKFFRRNGSYNRLEQKNDYEILYRRYFQWNEKQSILC